ncbi:unnamed protein product [Rhizopus stolonifer]
MARQQKKGKPANKPTNKIIKKSNQRKPKEDKLTSNDVFEAEEQTDRRKGNNLDTVDNLEYNAGEIEQEDDEKSIPMKLLTNLMKNVLKVLNLWDPQRLQIRNI